MKIKTNSFFLKWIKTLPELRLSKFKMNFLTHVSVFLFLIVSGHICDRSADNK